MDCGPVNRARSGYNRRTMDALVDSSVGRVRLVSFQEACAQEFWPQAWAHRAKDHRYHRLVHQTLDAQFDFRWLLVEDASGVPKAVQPCFFVDQDLVLTAPRPVRRATAWVRRVFPRFLRLRMLMVGCPAGEGHLPTASTDAPWLIQTAAAGLRALARQGGAWMVIWKDWPPSYRAAFEPLTRTGVFLRIPSMPATALELPFSGFEDYMARHLSHATRKNLRRKFKASKDAGLVMSVVSDVSGITGEVHALYEQVRARSPLQFERLTPEFLAGLGRAMPDRARFFLWRREGRLVACSICLEHDGVLYDEYLGLDYAVALELHLYFVTLRDVLSWAMAQGLRSYRSTPLNYQPKLHLGLRLAPLDLHVAGVSRVVHAVLRGVLPWIGPARSEPVLGRFPNAREMF